MPVRLSYDVILARAIALEECATHLDGLRMGQSLEWRNPARVREALVIASRLRDEARELRARLPVLVAESGA